MAHAPTHSRLVKVMSYKKHPGRVRYVIQVPGNRPTRQRMIPIKRVNGKTDIYKPLRELIFKLKAYVTRGIISSSTLHYGGKNKDDFIVVQFVTEAMATQYREELRELFQKYLDK